MWLCASRPDGPPHVTPVWFVYEEGAPEAAGEPGAGSPPRGVWWIGTGARAAKMRLLERDPKVTLALEDGEGPLVAEGEARMHRTRFPDRVREAFLSKYGWDPAIPERPGEPRVLLEITVRRWLLGGEAG